MEDTATAGLEERNGGKVSAPTSLSSHPLNSCGSSTRNRRERRLLVQFSKLSFPGAEQSRTDQRESTQHSCTGPPHPLATGYDDGTYFAQRISIPGLP